MSAARRKNASRKSHFGKTHVTNPGRLTFPELARPKAFKSGDPKYSASLVLKPSDNLTALQNSILETGRLAFGDDYLQSHLYNPIVSGEEIMERSPNAPEFLYTGNFRLLAKGNQDKEPPKCYLADKSLMPRRPGNEDDLRAIEQQFYPGCYARMAVTPFSFDVGNSQGVGLILKGIQWIADGERFGQPDLDSAFSDPWDDGDFEIGDEMDSAFDSETQDTINI